MSIFRNPFTSKNTVLIVGDVFITLSAIYMAIYLRFPGNYEYIFQNYSPILPKAIIFSLLILIMCFFVDLYGIEKRGGKKEIVLKILLSGFIASFVLASFYYIVQVPSIQLGRSTLYITIIISVMMQAVWHLGYDLFLRLPVGAKKVLILGTGPIAKTMGNILRTNGNGFALSGYVNCIGEPMHVSNDMVIGNGEGILDIALREKVHKIVVSLSERRGTFPVKEVLNCKLNGIDIVDGHSFYEQLTGKLLIENMNPSHLIFSDGFRITVFRRYIKRLFDIVLAVLGVVFALPLLIVLPLLIKLDSRGPVFFKQKRMGEGEKIFMVYKFRTMVDGAEKNTGPVWSQTGDRRITKLGRFMRKARLDEVPQLFNVINGDMSFIGPRPERPFFVETLQKQIPYYSERHCIKPGITGWAQVRYEYGDSIEDTIEKLRYDLYYIKYQSISLDLLIVLDTVKVILFGKGGR